MKCNGCGGEFDYLGGMFGYGNIKFLREGGFSSEYTKTLCPRCQHVLKDILKSSDLSEHWHKYEWSLMGGAYSRGYADRSRDSLDEANESDTEGYND